MEDVIHGLSLSDCAEIMSKDGELKARHGEPAYRSHFQKYLVEKGLSEDTFAKAWNGWWARMESDPSGQLHAKFAVLQQQLTMKAHMADVPDASGQAKEGVTLEAYAKIMAGAAGGQDIQALVSGAGLAWEQWQRSQAAWNQAMSEDVNHHLTTQYGQLYAKHTPGFAQQMQGQAAAMQAAIHAQREAGAMQDDEPEQDYTFADALTALSSPKPAVRWSAAHHLFNFHDIGSVEENPELHRALEAIPVALDCLEHHDEYTASDAEALARDLATMAGSGALTSEQAEEASSTMRICLDRAEEHLSNLEAAFAPIRDKAVPERVKMQSSIQDYTSLIETLQETLEDWDSNLQLDSKSKTSKAASASSGAQTAAGGEGGGLLATLKGLPVLGSLLRALGF